MKIVKFKKRSKNKYKIYFDNDSDIILFEDVIINNNLLSKKEIDNDELLFIIKQNNDITAYEDSISYISVRMRSTREIKDYLKKKNIDSKLIDTTINKLKVNGYLNDYIFSKALVHDEFYLSNKGPIKIKSDLKKHNINDDTISELISEIKKDDIKEKLDKLINKYLKLKKGSSNNIKLKLINYFTDLGYEKTMILDCLYNHEINSDINLLQKEYDKLYKKYCNKYEGEYLDYFISSKLYQKGYTKEDINCIKKTSN